ncbi:unnamed protein product [Cylindrotheca closterium]|uniref:Helicase-associated domain-containing protein n=1 Tax=Cylindrotheca closterium TaxID=2856 RepID=A0AAD2G9G9_9STRA|nr:unnamed protein product [Cylindrotheca closterium]
MILHLFSRRHPNSIGLGKVAEGRWKRFVMSKAMPSVPGNIRVSDELYLQIQRLCHYSQRLPNINVFGTTLRTFTSISKPVDESDDKSSPVGTKIIEIDTISWSDDPAKWLKETCMSYQFADKKKSTVDKLLPDQWMNTHNASHWMPRIMKAMWKKRNLGTDADDRYVCDFMALCEAVNRLEDATDLEKIAANLLEKIIVFQSHASPEKHCEVHHTWPVCALGSIEDPRNYKVVSWKAHLLCHIALASLFPSIRGFNLTVARMLHLGESKLTEEEVLACLEREELVGAAANARERAYQDLLDATQRQWDDWFDQLLAFKDEHGHCLVPQSFPRFGMWVNTQRGLYRKGILSDDRKRQLEAIGFVWNPFDE